MWNVRRNGRLVWGLVFYLLAWGLRAAAVGAHRLHPDEALYGYWGLLVLSGRDPWLATVPVYKPPVLPYLTAGSLALLGRSELAVRLPGLAAGLATVGLTGRLAWRMYRDPLASLVAGVVVVLSPFTLLFSATGFTDPLMVALGLAGCVAAAEGRPGWAGLLTGLSFAAKQTGVMWLPMAGFLVVASGVLGSRFAVRGRRNGGVSTGLVRGGVGFLAVLGLVWGWDQVRVLQGADSFWQAGVVGYGGLRMIWSVEWGDRARAWLDWLRYLLGAPLLDGLVVGGAAVLVVRGVRHRDWPALFDLVLIGSCLGYLLIHWLWAFPVWDRYLLPLVPLVGVILGRVVGEAAGGATTGVAPTGWWVGLVVLSVVAVCLAGPAGSAIAGRVPVGAGMAAYDGVEQVMGLMRGLPEGAVLYHHWLGWEYAFYLFGEPLYLAYWPTPTWLARDVRAFGETGTRYVVFPAWESSVRVEAALAEVGYRLEPVLVAATGLWLRSVEIQQR
ncbi:MAG TPA: DUF2029 domain-containing protein, partial [Anaerolineae bacterium]|nr:DUF2029 domain-containing protein [Anaerolineae bacterium]